MRRFCPGVVLGVLFLGCLMTAASAQTGSGNFYQLVCTSQDCSCGCTNNSLPQGRCYSLAGDYGGLWGRAYCRTSALEIEAFSDSGCTGAVVSRLMEPLNECLTATGDVTVEYTCPSSISDLNDFGKRHYDCANAARGRKKTRRSEDGSGFVLRDVFLNNILGKQRNQAAGDRKEGVEKRGDVPVRKN